MNDIWRGASVGNALEVLPDFLYARLLSLKTALFLNCKLTNLL